ncbi:tagatose-6-phosphate ketose isomerase [Vagococcus penaei]|uniref:Tagatose-6-phosphate ketose isomerase n=1 Tax=Vagococcus penaei TaxID=633807 RepID=A0A1Q2D5B9_9ENTE|nr:SIS domain-containing protein [Vagococcus penaei]AQP53407.1 tagatose-6-phosphate ketose isomerase [Vagococcus penaei]RST98633.1 tagatose-6-phosphate ketose isomerase [Vagococcus penaei]
MLDWNQAQLEEVGAVITTREISQQPTLWRETLAIFNANQVRINQFLDTLRSQVSDKVRVIFTGAGTSAYVGDVIRPHLMRFGNTDAYQFEAIPTTDIVSAPRNYFKANEPTLLVSFARSGNSPESVAAIELANELIDNVKHLIISCAPDGKLAINASDDANSYVILMPELSNDKGFAMTGSFSCMALTALLTFDHVNTQHEVIVDSMVSMGEQVINLEPKIQAILDQEFNRVVYLGSASLSGLTREAQLKLLELTAGKVATAFDSSLGFRHGPKSFVDEKTLVFGFISNDDYTSQYDVDILEEIKGNDIAAATVAIAQNKSTYTGDAIILENEYVLPDGYLALPYVMVAQVISLLTAVKVGNKPDTPSPTGTVNRVVQGVIIHSL